VDPEPELISGFFVLIDTALECAFVNAGDPGVNLVSDSSTRTI
jgi:hypothetical protein